MENPFSIIDQRLANIEKCLDQLMNAIAGQSQNDPVAAVDDNISYNIMELAAYLGVTKTTIFRYKKNQVFPFYQAGRTVYFKKHDVDAALFAGKKKR
jgi:excisionase family DNA binding protein